MILLDTHVWVWWVQGDPRLSQRALQYLDGLVEDEIGVHVISCWEVAMLCAGARLTLPCEVNNWIEQALAYPGVRLVPLSRTAAVASCHLPGSFHKDPADRMLVASALELDCPVLTADAKINAYKNVRAIHPDQLTF